MLNYREATIKDINLIIKNERNIENIPFIDTWDKKEHEYAINNNNIAYWVVEYDGKIVGHIILENLFDYNDSLFFRRIVITDKGKGFGRYSVLYVLKFAFIKNSYHRVWLNIKEGNMVSTKLFTSLGFLKEGTSRESSKEENGIYLSMDVYSLLSYEFNSSIRK